MSPYLRLTLFISDIYKCRLVFKYSYSTYVVPIGASEQGGRGYRTPHSKIWGAKYVLPPHEICYNKLYIYIY